MSKVSGCGVQGSAAVANAATAVPPVGAVGIPGSASAGLVRIDARPSVPGTQYSVLSTDTTARTTQVRRSPPSSASAALLRATRLEKSYRKGKLVVPVLKGVDFHIREGGFVAVVGQS